MIEPIRCPAEPDVDIRCTGEYYWNQLPKEMMRDLIQRAVDFGWRGALEWAMEECRRTDGNASALSDYMTARGRSYGAQLACPTPDDHVLDVGPGWGAVGLELAPSVSSITMADATLETLEFLSVRAQQEGLTNVRCVRVGPLGVERLPFEDASFSLVIMNGVLEWLGCGTTADSPIEVQLRGLADAWRVLRPGGRLVIGIENRWHYRHWIDESPHGEPFLYGVAPRRLASLIRRVVGGAPVRTMIHSPAALKRLLHQAGFESNVFWIHPDYRHPRTAVDLWDRHALSVWAGLYLDSPLKRAVIRLLPLWAVRTFLPHSLLVVGVRREASS